MSFKLKKITASRALLTRFLNKERLSLKLLLGSILTGLITGGVCVVFETTPILLGKIREISLSNLNLPTYACYLIAFLISACLGGIAIYLTRKYAPEASGSGIPEIEGAMIDLRPVKYKQLLPVKFFGGLLSLSSGMIVGREGPSIQIGGNLGAMVSDKLKFTQTEFHTLLAAGAAAGLASAFNAPLAGILFVIEELRPQFKFSFSTLQAVAIAVLFSTIIRDLIVDNNAVFAIPVFENVGIFSLPSFLILGVAAGFFGVFFNKGISLFQDLYQYLHRGILWKHVAIVAIVAGIFGMLSFYNPFYGNSGMGYISSWIVSKESLGFWFTLIFIRIIGIFLCFSSGVPGGIFAPSLAVGTLLGGGIGIFINELGLTDINPSVMCIAGMAAFFAASVRSPVTGIILVCEMTNNFYCLLPMMVASYTSIYIAGLLNGRPIYVQLLERTLRMSGNKKALVEYKSFLKNSGSD
ncbi:MAG: H(+)/Cl(-) exchange transporter ClcA [Succinivibrionaceae bacterium]